MSPIKLGLATPRLSLEPNTPEYEIGTPKGHYILYSLPERLEVSRPGIGDPDFGPRWCGFGLIACGLAEPHTTDPSSTRDGQKHFMIIITEQNIRESAISKDIMTLPLISKLLITIVYYVQPKRNAY